jgi:hypothetical protein
LRSGVTGSSRRRPGRGLRRTEAAVSGRRRYRERCGRNSLELIAKPLAEAWGPGRRRLAWPLALRAARA